jgi:hypothetical protein
MSPVEDRIMNKLVAVLMLFLPLTGVLAADNGGVTNSPDKKRTAIRFGRLKVE